MDVLILTHGAGSNRDAPLLKAIETELTTDTFRVERVNLAFRDKKPKGSPSPADGAKDREGLATHVAAVRAGGAKRVFLGGMSYGGRQSSMLVAENAGLVDGLILLSYPLHPPGRPDKPRTAHLPQIVTPALFLHGDRDPFGTLEELRAALAMIPANKKLLVEIPKVGHDLGGAKGKKAPVIAAAFREFFAV